jgi:hypothetical protein
MQHTVTLNNEIFNLVLSTYKADNSISISLYTQDNIPFAHLTNCQPDINLAYNQIVVKLYSENEVLKPLIKDKTFIDTGIKIPSGFVELNIWEITNQDLLDDIEKIKLQNETLHTN